MEQVQMFASMQSLSLQSGQQNLKRRPMAQGVRANVCGCGGCATACGGAAVTIRLIATTAVTAVTVAAAAAPALTVATATRSLVPRPLNSKRARKHQAGRH